MLNPVAQTALLVAAMRAEETRRPDPLFTDPFAATLAGPEGVSLLERYRGTGPGVPVIEVRTRFFDDAFARAVASGIRQVVVLAAGMDSRAFRLEWPAGTRLFEVDQPEMIAAKAARLGDAQPRCQRIAIPLSLANDWPAALLAHGFDRGARTVFLVEGLLQYLDEPAVTTLFARLEPLAAPSSVLLFDLVGRSLLESPVVADLLAIMRELGAPWTFGSDDPAALVPSFDCRVTEPAVVGNALGRWPFPAVPRDVPNVPRGYLVEGTRR
jgi:methyltransferase (TIGR00027 family)